MSEFDQGAPSGADTAPEPAAPPSLDDITTRALEIAGQRQADRDAGKDVPAELPSAAPDRARDKGGKFAPKPKPSETPEPAEAKAPKPAPAAGTTSAPAPAAAAPAALQPNPRWSEADKATFTRLPLEAQKSILDMAGRQDAAFTQKSQEVADQRRAIEPLVAAYNEHAEFLNLRSREIAQPPARILGDMVHLYRQGTTGQPHERAQALGFVAQLFGIDLRSLAQGGQGQAPQEQVPPAIARELQQLRQQVLDLNGFRQSTVQRDERQTIQTAQQQIDGFRTAKDEQGLPKYPYFDAVRGNMAQHVEAGKSFDEAYEIAAKPITDAIVARETHAAQAREAGEAKARDAASADDTARAAQVAAARKAGGPRPAGSRPGLVQSRDLDTIAWDNLKKVGLA